MTKCKHCAILYARRSVGLARAREDIDMCFHGMMTTSSTQNVTE